MKSSDETRRLAVTPLSLFPVPYPTLITTVFSHRTCNYYGAIPSSQLISEASWFVMQNSDAQMNYMEETLGSFLDRTREDYLGGKVDDVPTSNAATTAAWLCIRMTKSTNAFTIPRWHRDGRMFPSDRKEQIHSKYAMTLLGPPTLVLVDSDLVNKVVTKDDNPQEVRVEYANRLSLQPLVEIEQGQIIRFTWGQINSPVHSEPNINCDRVFVSVLYGSEAEIRQMCEWREEQYRE